MMDPFDLIIEQLQQPETEEIEHWCPVCDRLILPSQKLVGPPQSGQPPATPTTNNETTKASTQTSPSANEAPTPTTPTSAQRSNTSSPVFRRKSAQGHGAHRGGGRPVLHRSRTSTLNATTTGLQHKRKPDHANRSNPNFVQDLVLSTHGGGAAPRAKTSPIGNTSHPDNARVDEDLQGEPELVLRTSDRPADPQSREALPPTMAPMKRKSSAPDVNAGPRLKPLTKSKFNTKPRPKSLNLITALITESKDVVTPTTSKTLVPSGVTTPSDPLTAVDPPETTRPKYKVEDLRRRLYCSEECYNIDLKGEKFDVYRPPSPSYDSPVSGTPPVTPPSKGPYQIKRNMSCEMPWLWTNAISRNAVPRRMAPTRNPSWLASGEDESSYSERDHIPSVSERVLSWPPFPQTKTGPLGVPARKVVLERKLSKPLQPQEVDALRRMAPAFNGERSPIHLDSPVDLNSSSEFCRLDSDRILPTGAPMRKARPLFEDEKNKHQLFFRRMPGKLDAAPVTMPPLFVVDGQWTETPPPGFDYTTFMENREKERRKRQVEITEAMLLRKKVDAIGAEDEVTRRHHELGRRKKRVDADKSQYERRARTMHGTGYFANPQSGKHHQAWWHLDEQEDWKTYWAARDGGLEDVTFEQWQLQRHAERVERAEREQALRRIEGDRRRVHAEVAGVRAAGDGKKVAKRPLLIRVASQPTVSDVDLVGRLYKEGETRTKQYKARTASFLAGRATSSSSSEASPLGMHRTKALPMLTRSVDSNTAPEQAASPSSFMRGRTLCIPGFVVEHETPKKTVEKPLSPKGAGFVFPLVAIPGSVEPSVAIPVETVSTAIKSPPKSPSLRVPPGLGLPSSAVISPVPKSPPGNPPGLARPQLKKSTTLPIDPSASQLSVPNDTPSHLSPRRRIQSLKSMTLTLPDLPKTELDDTKRSSLLLPRSPLGLHSFSAAEILVSRPETCDLASVQPSRKEGPSSVGRSSTTRGKQFDTGSHRRTLPPLVIHETATASMSPACAYSSEQSLSLAQHGKPADVVMGSPEVITAVSGIGSGSGSSGEESTWSRADVRPKRNATIKATSTRTVPRVARGLALTQVRPKSMGPLELSSIAKVPSAKVEASKEPEIASPLSYSASLLRFYSDFRSGSVPGGTTATTKSPPTTDTGSTEQDPQVGKRRSLWGIFGSAKP